MDGNFTIIVINFKVKCTQFPPTQIMRQISSQVGSPNRRTPKVDRMEAEYQQNQERIRQLHRRNRNLAEQMRGAQQDTNTLPIKLIAQRSPLKTRRPRSFAQLLVGSLDKFSRVRIGRYPLSFWLKVTIMMLLVALVCGFLGFMATRLIGLLIGG
jgi:hypothetical protein